MQFRKKAKAGINTVKGRILGRNVPVSVTLRVTYRCDFMCDYCITGTLEEDEMSTSQIKLLIDEFARLGTQKMTFTGGEPLIREDVGELIDYCAEKEIITVLGSNGYLFPKFIGRLKNLDILALSLDGKAATHDKQRRKVGSHQKVLEAIELALKHGIQVFTNTTITNSNKEHIGYILDLAKKMGFKAIMQPVVNADYAKDTIKSHLLSKEDFELVTKELIRLKEMGEPIVYSTTTYKYFYDSYYGTSKNKNLRCWAGKLFCSVTPEGNVYPCSGLVNKVKSLNGTKVGFANAFLGTPDFSCDKCEYTCYINNNLLFAFDFKTIMNMFKIF